MPNPTPPDQPAAAGLRSRAGTNPRDGLAPDLEETAIVSLPAEGDAATLATDAADDAPAADAVVAAGAPPRPPADRPAPSGGRGPRLGAIAVIVLASVLGVGGILGGTTLLSRAAPASPSAVAVVGSPSGAPASGTAGASAAATPSDAAPSAVVASASPAPASATPAPTVAPSASPSAAPTASPSDGVPSGRLQRSLDALRERYRLPGVSVAILWDDGRRWLGAAGYRDVAAKDPMTTGTAFALASISKTLTAGVVLQLVQEGRLALDTPVARLLPEFRLDRRITVRMLLDHTSGLPDYFLNPKIDRPLQRAPAATWDAGQAWAFVPPKRPKPGTTWAYSNSNYLLLGELVERVTGNPLPTEIRTRLLDPLGLETAWYQVAEKPKAKGTLGYRTVVNGRRWRSVPVAAASDVMPFRSVVSAAGGAGSIAATALDAARWMQAYAGGRVVGPELQAAMVADVTVTGKLKARIPYGLGIQAVPIGGHYALGHSGRFLGFRNVVRYLPEYGITIAVLTNQGTSDPAKVAATLLKSVLPRPTPSPAASPAASGSPAASTTP